jgi:integrase
MQHGAVSAVWKGIKRTHGTAQAQKAPTLTANIRAMVGALPDRLIGIRDRALLLAGFAGAFRRSELVGLNREDIDFTADGLVVTLRKSKTDQDGQGRKVGLPYGSNPDTCPVRSLRAWLDASGIAAGPLFRRVNRHGQLLAQRMSGAAVALVVKRHAAAAGLDAAKYSGHSLRAGLATSAAIAGASDRSIMAQTGHRSVNMVRRYVRDASLFRENAAAVVGM